MTDIVLQWRDPADPYAVRTPATIIGPPGPRAGERLQSLVSAGAVTPSIALYDFVDITALAQALSIENPVGTPAPGAPRLMFRIKDDGTSRALTWATSYVSGGVPLPSATVTGKIMLLGFLYYSSTSKWMLVASTVEP